MAFTLYSAKGKEKETKTPKGLEEVETLFPGQGSLQSAQTALQATPKKPKAEKKELVKSKGKPKLTTKESPEALDLEESEQPEDTSSSLAETFEKAESITRKKGPYSFNANSQYEIDTDPYYRVFEHRGKTIISSQPDTYIVMDYKTGSYNVGYKLGDGSVSWSRLTSRSKVLVAKMVKALENVPSDPEAINNPNEPQGSMDWGQRLGKFLHLTKRAVAYGNAAIFNIYIASGEGIIPEPDWQNKTFVKSGEYYKPVGETWEPEEAFVWYKVIASVLGTPQECLLGMAKHRGTSTFDIYIADVDGSNSHKARIADIKLFNYISGDQIDITEINDYYEKFSNKESAKQVVSADTIATDLATEEVNKLDSSTFFFVDGNAPKRIITGTRYEILREGSKAYIKAASGPAKAFHSDLNLRTALNAESIPLSEIDQVARITNRKSGFYHADMKAKMENVIAQGHAVQFEIGSMGDDGTFYPTGKDEDVFWAIIPTGRDFYMEVSKIEGGSASITADTKTLEMVSTSPASPDQLKVVSKLISSVYPVFSKETYGDEALREQFSSLLITPPPNPLYGFDLTSKHKQSKELLLLFINYMFNNLEAKLTKDTDYAITSKENVLAKVDSYLGRVTKLDADSLAQLFFGSPITHINADYIDKFYEDIVGAGADQDLASTEEGLGQLRRRGKFVDSYIQSPMIGQQEAGKWFIKAVEAVTIEPSGIYVIEKTKHGTTKKKQNIYLAERNLDFESGTDTSRLPFGAVSFSMIDFRTGNIVANVMAKESGKYNFQEISKDDFIKAFYSSRPTQETLAQRLTSDLKGIGLTTPKAKTVSKQLVGQLAALLSDPEIIANILGVPEEDVATWLHGPDKLDEKILAETIAYFSSLLGEDKYMGPSVALELEKLVSQLTTKAKKFNAKDFIESAPTIAAELMLIVLNKLRGTDLMYKVATEARRSLDAYYNNTGTAAFVKVSTGLYSGPCAVFSDKKDESKIILYQEGRIYNIDSEDAKESLITNTISSKNVFYVASMGQTAVKADVTMVDKADRLAAENIAIKDIMTFVTSYNGDTISPADFIEFLQTTIVTKLNVKLSSNMLNKVGRMAAMPKDAFTQEKAQQIAKIFSAAAFIPRILGHIMIYDIAAGKSGQMLKIYRDVVTTNGFWAPVPSDWSVDPKVEKSGIVVYGNSRESYIKNLITATRPAPAFGDMETTIASMDRDWGTSPESQAKVYDFFRKVNYVSGMCLAKVVSFEDGEESGESEFQNIQIVNQKIQTFFMGPNKKSLASNLRYVIESGHKRLSKDVRLYDPSTLARKVAYWAMQNLHISASFIGLSSNSTVEFNRSSFVDLINAYLAMPEKFKADNLYTDALYAAIKVSLSRAMNIIMTDRRYQLERETILARIPEEYLSDDAVSRSKQVELVQYLTQALMSYWLSNLASISAPSGKMKVNQKFTGFEDLVRDPDEVVAGLAAASPEYLIGMLLWTLADNKVQRAVRSSLGGANTGITFQDTMQPDKLTLTQMQQLLHETLGSFTVSLMSILDKSGHILNKYYNVAILKDYNKSRIKNKDLSLRAFAEATINDEYRAAKIAEAWSPAFEEMKTRATVAEWKSSGVKGVMSPSFALASKFGAGAVIAQGMSDESHVNNGVPFLITAMQAMTKDHRFAFKMTADILEHEDFSETLPFAAQEIKRILEAGKFKYNYKNKLDADSLKKYLLNVYFEIRRRRQGAYYVRPEDSMATMEGQTTAFEEVVKELANKKDGLTKYSFGDIQKEFNFASLPHKTKKEFTPMDKFFEVFKKQLTESGMNHMGAFSSIMQTFNYSKNYASFPLLVYMMKRNLGTIPNLSDIQYNKDFFETMGRALAATVMDVSKLNTMTDAAARGMQKSFVSGGLNISTVISNIMAFVYCLNNPDIGQHLRELNKLDSAGRVSLNRKMMSTRYGISSHAKEVLGVPSVSVSPDFVGMLDQSRVSSLAEAIRAFSSRHQDIEDVVDYIHGEATYIPEEAKKLFEVFASMAGHQLNSTSQAVRIGNDEAIDKVTSGNYDASSEPSHNAFVVDAINQINENLVYNVFGATEAKMKFNPKKPFDTGAIPVDQFSNFTDAMKAAMKAHNINTSDDLIGMIYNTRRDFQSSGEQLYDIICKMVTSMLPKQAPDSGAMPASPSSDAAWNFYVTQDGVDSLVPKALKDEIINADVEDISVADVLAMAEKVFETLSIKLTGKALDDLATVKPKLSIGQKALDKNFSTLKADISNLINNKEELGDDEYATQLYNMYSKNNRLVVLKFVADNYQTIGTTPLEAWDKIAAIMNNKLYLTDKSSQTIVDKFKKSLHKTGGNKEYPFASTGSFDNEVHDLAYLATEIAITLSLPHGKVTETFSVPVDIQNNQMDVQRYYRTVMATNAEKHVATLRTDIKSLTSKYQDLVNGAPVKDTVLALSKIILDKKHRLDLEGVACKTLIRPMPLSERIETNVLEDVAKTVLVLPARALKSSDDKTTHYIVMQDLTFKKITLIPYKNLPTDIAKEMKDSGSVVVELYPGAESDIAVLPSVMGSDISSASSAVASHLNEALGDKVPTDKAEALLVLFGYQLSSIIMALTDTLTTFESYRMAIIKRMGFNSGSYAVISPSLLEISETVPIIQKNDLPVSFKEFLSDMDMEDQNIYLDKESLKDLVKTVVPVKVLKVDRTLSGRKCAIVSIDIPGEVIKSKSVPTVQKPPSRRIIANVPYEYLSSAAAEKTLPGVYFAVRERLIYSLSHPIPGKEALLKKFEIGPTDPAMINTTWLRKHLNGIQQAEEAGAILPGTTTQAKRLLDRKFAEPARTIEPLIGKLSKSPVIIARDLHSTVLDVLKRTCKGDEQASMDIDSHLAPIMPKMYSLTPVKTRTLANASGQKSIRFDSGSELVNAYWLPSTNADADFQKNIGKYYDTARAIYGVKKTKSAGLIKAMSEATIIAPAEKALALLNESLLVAEEVNDDSMIKILSAAIESIQDHFSDDLVSNQSLVLLTRAPLGDRSIIIPVSKNMFCSLQQLMAYYTNWSTLKSKLVMTPKLAEVMSGGQELPCSFTYLESYADGSEIKVRIADMGDGFKVVPHKFILKSPTTGADLGVATGGSNSYLEDSSARADKDFVKSKDDKAIKVLNPSALSRIRNVNGLRLVVYNGQSFTKKFEAPILPNAISGIKIKFEPQRAIVMSGDRYEIVSDASVSLNPDFSLRATRERGKLKGGGYDLKVSDSRSTFVRTISGDEQLKRIRSMMDRDATIYEILGAEFGNLGDIIKEQMNQIAITQKAHRTAELRQEQGGDADLCADLRALGSKFQTKGRGSDERVIEIPDNTIFDDLNKLKCIGIGTKIQPLIHPTIEGVEDTPAVNASIALNTIDVVKRAKFKRAGFASGGGVNLLNDLIGKRKPGATSSPLQASLQHVYNTVLNDGWNEFINKYEMSASKQFAKKNPYINLIDNYKKLLEAKQNGVSLGTEADRQFKALSAVIGAGKSYLNMSMSKVEELIKDDTHKAVLSRFHDITDIEKMITNSHKDGRGQHASRVSKQLFLLGSILAYYIYLAKHEPTVESADALKWYERFLKTEAQGIVFNFIKQFGLLDAGARLGITGVRGKSKNLFIAKSPDLANVTRQLEENIKIITDSIAANDGTTGYVMGLSNFFGLMPLSNRVLINVLFKDISPFGVKRDEKNPQVKEVSEALNNLFQEIMLGDSSVLQLDASTNMAIGELPATFLPENFRKLLAIEEEYIPEEELEMDEGEDLTPEQIEALGRNADMLIIQFKKAMPIRFAKLISKPRKLKVTTMKCKTFGDTDLVTEPSSPMNIPEDNKRRQEQASSKLLLFKYADENVIDAQIEELRIVLAENNKNMQEMKEQWTRVLVNSIDLKDIDEKERIKFAEDTFKDFTKFIYKRDNLYKNVDQLPAMLEKLYEIISGGHKYDKIPTAFMQMFFSYRSPAYSLMRSMVSLFNDNSFLAEQNALIEDVISSNSLDTFEDGNKSMEGEDAPEGTLMNPHT